MAELNDERPLRKISEAFKELAATVNSQTAEVGVAPFSRASSLLSHIYCCLGIGLKFAEMDYVAKVNDLAEASKSIDTLQALVERDVEANTVRKFGSHSRNLLRVKRGIDAIKVFFEKILVTEGNSIKDPASKAYAEVLAPHHAGTIRKAVDAGMHVLPTWEKLLKKLNEDDTSARIQMQSFVTASAPVILYVEKLFLSRELGIDCGVAKLMEIGMPCNAFFEIGILIDSLEDNIDRRYLEDKAKSIFKFRRTIKEEIANFSSDVSFGILGFARTDVSGSTL